MFKEKLYPFVQFISKDDSVTILEWLLYELATKNINESNQGESWTFRSCIFVVEVTIFVSSISGIMLISSEVRAFMEEFGLGLIGRDSALLIRIFILIL